MHTISPTTYMVGSPGPLFTHVRPESALATAASAGRPRRLTQTPHPLLTGVVTSGHSDIFIGYDWDSKPLRALPPEWHACALPLYSGVLVIQCPWYTTDSSYDHKGFISAYDGKLVIRPKKKKKKLFIFFNVLALVYQ